jgi:hypothetical protein
MKGLNIYKDEWSLESWKYTFNIPVAKSYRSTSKQILIICQSLNSSSSKAEFNIFKLRKDFRRINIFEHFSVFTNIFQLSAYLDQSKYMVLSLCGSFILLNKSGYHIKSKGNKTVFIYIFINKNYMFKPRGFLLSELLILLQPWLTSL